MREEHRRGMREEGWGPSSPPGGPERGPRPGRGSGRQRGRSGGRVSRALQLLEDEGLIAPQGTGRRRVFTLTDKGRTYVEAHADELRSSWDAAAGMTDDDAIEFRNLIRQVMMAVMEVRRAGSRHQTPPAPGGRGGGGVRRGRAGGHGQAQHRPGLPVPDA